LILVAVAFALAVCAPASAAPNFSGNWKFNAGKSNYGPIPAPDKMERKITHEEPTLKMTTVQSGQQGEITTDMTYKTDGSESVNKVRGNDVKSVAKWDGAALTVASKREVQGMEITQNERWTLSDDGKILTILNKINTPQGEFEITIVMDKQ
jgi:hypothetical protein